MELVDQGDRDRLHAAATRVLECIELAERKKGEYLAIRQLEPLVEEARQHERRYAFREALPLYERLIEEHPDAGTTVARFRDRAKRCTEIIHYLDELAKASQAVRAKLSSARVVLDEVLEAADTDLAARSLDRRGRAVRGHLDRETGERFRVGEAQSLSGPDDPTDPPPGNTTLTVVVVNQSIGPDELRQLARQVHASMARAIDPFHTAQDGDVLYAVSTHQLDRPAVDAAKLSYIASELAWDAVLNSF